ncbi:glycosyltransferase family 2 protein [Chlorogloeopsis sp. ULAP02]|uniref:glycosyltransferase family 2 protein n=1 Tax=Chlorogloeopsis sp. ULAP02 TaxID=3107926 RepID=UPI00313489F4
MISVVIPAFNEAENIPNLYRRIISAAQDWQMPFEVIMVDDGSKDKTLELLQKLHAKDSRFKYISFSRNFGHQTAVSAGLVYAQGDVVAILDADLQDPPEEIHRFLEKWRQGYQVIYGIRTNRKENFFKKSAYYLFYRILAWCSSIEIPLDSGDFCIMDRTVVSWLNAMPERNRFIRGLRSWIGYRQIGVPYERQARFAGEVKYTFRKLMRLALDGIINFSYRPLQIAGTFGFFVAIISFLGIIFFFLHRILNFKIFGYSPQDVPGFTSVILSLLFIGGVQLFTMGLFGEYIGRIFDEVKQRPLYIIKDQRGFDNSSTLLPGNTRL